MIASRSILFALMVVCMTATLTASGPVGFYGIIEKVVLEPNERQPERIQVWGAFAYVDGAAGGLSISEAKGGYLYFKLPNNNAATGGAELKEWQDLKSVAGTGQAVGFGKWGYIGSFDALRRDNLSNKRPYILDGGPSRGGSTDMRIRPAAERPASPAAYQTNAGVVKLSDKGSHAEIVKLLKAALAK